MEEKLVAKLAMDAFLMPIERDQMDKAKNCARQSIGDINYCIASGKDVAAALLEMLYAIDLK